MVIRPGITCEDLIVLRGQAQCPGARIGIEEGISCDGVLSSVLRRNGHGMDPGVKRLDAVARFPQVGALGADVADVQYPVSSQLMLNTKIPLLRARRNVVLRQLEAV